MTLNAQLIWFLGMAATVTAILAVGTLLAADLIHTRPAGRGEGRRVGTPDAARPEPVGQLATPAVLVAPMGPRETARLAAGTSVVAHRRGRAIVDEWGEDSFPASDPPQNW